MYSWYKQLTVQIKWKEHLSQHIPVRIGTRQGGLSSPFLFNIFYQGLIEHLNKQNTGVNIAGHNYNAFCYADDIMLTSLTATGLQALINSASKYITDHGLRFNPSKTTCTTFGTNHLQPRPKWFINNSLLSVTESTTYLGTVLSDTVSCHVDSRVKAARGAFYSLQGAGLCKVGVNCTTRAHLFNTAILPAMTYGCSSIDIDNKQMNNMDKQLSGLVKTSLGLSKWCRNKALTTALGVKTVSCSVKMSQIYTLKSAIRGTSKAGLFYKYIMLNKKYRTNNHSNLVTRVAHTCREHSFSFLRLIIDDKYTMKCKQLLAQPKSDGVVDSLRYTLKDPIRNHNLIKLLLKPF